MYEKQKVSERLDAERDAERITDFIKDIVSATPIDQQDSKLLLTGDVLFQRVELLENDEIKVLREARVDRLEISSERDSSDLVYSIQRSKIDDALLKGAYLPDVEISLEIVDESILFRLGVGAKTETWIIMNRQGSIEAFSTDFPR